MTAILIQAEDFVTSFDTTPGNTPGQYRTNTDTDIENCNDTGGGYDVGWVASGEWLTFNVNIPLCGNYTIESRVSAITSGQTFHFEIDGVINPGTQIVPNTGDWQKYTSVLSAPIGLIQGPHTIKVVSDNGSANWNWFSLNLISSPHVVVDNTPPTVPGNISAVPQSQTAIDLSWGASTDSGGSGLKGYRVYRDGLKISDVTVTHYSDSGLIAGTTYSYGVSALDVLGNESAQITGSATTQAAPDMIAPSVPSWLNISVKGQTEVDIVWNTSIDTGGSALKGYKVYQSVNGGEFILRQNTPMTALNDTGLAPNTLYAYKVSAIDNAGNESAQSSVVSATTANQPIIVTGQRKRPTISKGIILSDVGTRLRGVMLPLDSGEVAPSNAVLNVLKTKGLNTLHVYAEAWPKGVSNVGYSLANVDKVVQWAKTNGVYVVITIGNLTSNGAFNLDYVNAFWKLYAPKYGGETHVIFEIQNEPFSWTPGYDAATLNMEISAYKLIRGLAPNTLIFMFTYANFSNPNGVLKDIGAVNSTVDWSNAAIAIHGYQTPAINSATLKAMRAQYPNIAVIDDEFMASTSGPLIANAPRIAAHENEGVGWTAFVNINTLATDSNFRTPLASAISSGTLTPWRPDYGPWPLNGVIS